MKWKREMAGVLWALTLGAPVAIAGCGGGGASLVAPTITAQSSSQSVAAGARVTLSVTGASLTIDPAAVGDSGAYYVVVSNSAGSVVSSSATVTVAASTGSGSVTVD